jgi:hypothetical protein
VSGVGADELRWIEWIGRQGADPVVTPSVAEVLFTGVQYDHQNDPPYGLASIPRVHHGQQPPPAFAENTYLFVGANVALDIRTLAHELGHGLANEFDVFYTPYIFFPSDGTIPDTQVDWQRRILHETAGQVRLVRPTGTLGGQNQGYGNRFTFPAP